MILQYQFSVPFAPQSQCSVVVVCVLLLLWPQRWQRSRPVRFIRRYRLPCLCRLYIHAGFCHLPGGLALSSGSRL